MSDGRRMKVSFQGGLRFVPQSLGCVRAGGKNFDERGGAGRQGERSGQNGPQQGARCHVMVTPGAVLGANCARNRA